MSMIFVKNIAQILGAVFVYFATTINKTDVLLQHIKAQFLIGGTDHLLRFNALNRDCVSCTILSTFGTKVLL